MHSGTFVVENKYGENDFQVCEECDPLLRQASRRCKYITIALFLIIPCIIFALCFGLNAAFDKDDA